MIDKRPTSSSVGAIVIGRNEGERLRSCLESVIANIRNVIYVDSGSSDNSVAMAKSLGVEVVELDMSIPFTAARARNAGFERLNEIEAELRFVQFIDGDCEIDLDWAPIACEFLDQHEDVAVVCGRRRERFPEKSIYNLLCDIEWETPSGKVGSCGGDAMMRTRAFAQVGGFRDDLIAGEEPELCVRFRQAGWVIWRLADEMTLHDADMTSFMQWWRRAIRGGYAFAQGTYLHGGPPEYQNLRDSLRIWFWALGVPAFTLLAIMLLGWSGLLVLSLYPLQMARIVVKKGGISQTNIGYAFYMTLGKFPEMWGQLKFYFYRIMRVKARLIEYK